MKTLRLALVALAAVAAIALVGGDPRGTHSMARSQQIALAGLGCSAALGVLAWRRSRASAWWLLPTVLAAILGALSGWIAAVELAGDTATVAHLATAPGRVVFLVAMTAAGMALPTAAVAAALRRFGRAGT